MRETRTLVMVAPHFPPSGLPPAHRARLFARHLPSFGWRPVVVTVSQRHREEPAEATLLRTVQGVAVEEVRALPARVTRRVGLGDLALRALPALYRRIVTVVRREKAAAILLIVPPWYLLLLVPMLSRMTSVPIVVDYVDPWRMAPGAGVKRRLAAWLALRLEGWCVRHISGLFAVSEAMNRDLTARFPRLAAIPQGAAPYGLEPDDFRLLAPARDTGAPADAMPPGKLVYVGVLQPLMYEPLEALLDAFVTLRESEPAAYSRLSLELVGTTYAGAAMATRQTEPMARARQLEDRVHERPLRVPYVDALTLMKRAGANVVLGDTTAYYAASKLMPTLAAGRPLVAFLHEDSSPAQLLRELGAPGLVTYGSDNDSRPANRVAQLAAVLRRAADGSLRAVAVDFTADPRLTTRTARAMTASLADVLDRATLTPTV